MTQAIFNRIFDRLALNGFHLWMEIRSLVNPQEWRREKIAFVDSALAVVKEYHSHFDRWYLITGETDRIRLMYNLLSDNSSKTI